MSNRFLIGMGLGFALVLVAGIGAVISVNSVTDRAAVAEDSPAPRTAPAPAAAPDIPPPRPNSSAVTPKPLPVASGSLAVPYTVLNSDLASLAAAVKLGSPSTGDVGKDVWAREVPVAQKLLGGMCDCDQRNWLKHFVETGQEAISGSNHFPESVQLLQQLRRGGEDLTSAQAAR